MDMLRLSIFWNNFSDIFLIAPYHKKVAPVAKKRRFREELSGIKTVTLLASKPWKCECELGFKRLAQHEIKLK